MFDDILGPALYFLFVRPVFYVIGLLYILYLSIFNMAKRDKVDFGNKPVYLIGQDFLFESMWIIGLVFLGLFILLVIYSAIRHS